MRAHGWTALVLTLAAGMTLSQGASADAMDPALSRLADDSCRVAGKNGGQFYNPQSGFARCATDDAAFAKLVAQYGFALASSATHSARTTGYGGFELSIEGSFTKIDSNADYWKKGTQGQNDAVSGNASIQNPSPAGVLQRYELKITKGFPFGFEISGAFGFAAQTGIFTIGADVRWSILEGFRRGVPAYFPELAVGGSVRTITGTDQFQLTIASADGELSKQIPIGGVMSITPYIGYQYMRIFGDSGLIDLTPNTDAVNYCGYTGSNTPYNPDPNKPSGNPDGQPVCGRGSSADFNNTAVFNPVRLNRHKLFGGLMFRVQMIKFGAQFAMDVIDPQAANKSAEARDLGGNIVNPYEGMPKQWTVTATAGAVF